ncbi:MAG TPA: 3-deoxy-D-manno-octulosonic acid transferase [Thermodesulfobacteriota bacterium]|nr:3-deoxy-D-manno-octulosonic acid transferase [Thermodesulfobacteriota bacterium]
MIFLTYNILLTFLLILVSPYFLFRSLFQERFRKVWSQRLGFFQIPSFKRSIWVHAASVGEVFCSLPLLKKIKKEFPDSKIVLTTITSTGNETAKARAPEADRILFFPVDHPLVLRRFIGRIQPGLLLIAETELWPNLLRTCGKKRIPIVLFNGRISPRSFRRYFRFKFFFKKCLKNISLFLMQTEEDRKRIVDIGGELQNTRTTGNLKFDQTFPPLSREARAEIAKALGLRGAEMILIAGSTHSGEEEILVRLYKELKRTIPQLVLILAPRHLERLEEVEEVLRKEFIPWSRKTALSLGTDSPSDQNTPGVILLDTMGELMGIYSLGTLVFVGGSLVPVGGHNPLEPLFFEKCVLFGPQMFNFLEISKRLVEAGGAIQVSGKEDFFSQLKRLLVDEVAREAVGEKGHQFLQRHQGATERMFEEVRPFLHKMGSADCGIRN